jgi:hypothetical protein
VAPGQGTVDEEIQKIALIHKAAEFETYSVFTPQYLGDKEIV